MSVHASGPVTRPTLLWRIRNPLDNEAWESFYTVYAPLIYDHCRRRGLQSADAENVTQIVFTQILRAIRSFEYQPEKGRFRGWLGAVVGHAISRHQKKRREIVWGDAHEESPLDREEARPEDSAWTEAFYHHIYRTALTRIRPQVTEPTWQAFDLVWHHNRPPLEVAEQLGLSIDQVYVAKCRVLERLRQEIELLAEDGALVAVADS